GLFDPTILSYEVFVERTVGQVVLAASSSHNATISNLGTKPLATTEHIFEIPVKAEDGTTTKTYVVKIIRKDSNNKISDITIDGISSLFVFNPSTLSYDLGTVRWDQTTITFDILLESNFATVNLNGTQVLKDGLNTFKVYATSERGVKGSEYTFTITKEAAYKDVNLSNLVVQDAILNKNLTLNYTPGTYNYAIEVNNEQRVRIVPTLKDASKQSIQSEIDLTDVIVDYNQDGTVNQVISFKVIAQGVEQTYTIRLFKGVTLSNNYNFELSIYDVYNTNYVTNFDLSQTEYDVNLPYAIDKLTFDVRLEHNKAKVVYIKPIPQTFKDGMTATVEFYVEAEDGSRSATYKISVTRALASLENRLNDLVLMANGEKILGKTGALYQFNEDTFTYNITLNENYTNALITYVKKVSSQEVT